MDIALVNASKDIAALSDSSSYENTTFLFENVTVLRNFDDDSKTQVFKLETVVNLLIYPFLTFVGLFGNTTTIIVFCLKKQKTASVIFIICLAISDLLYILIRLITHIYTICQIYCTEAIRNVEPTSFFWILLSQPFQQMGYIFVLVITTERLTAVWLPLRHRVILTTRRSRFICAVGMLLPLCDLVDVIDYLIFCKTEETPKEGTVSAFKEGLRYSYAKSSSVATWSLIHRLIFEVLPIPLVLVLNIFIIIGIRKSSFSEQDWNSTTKERSKREATITKMLMTISIMFVLFCGPFTVIGITLRALGPTENSVLQIVVELLFLLMLSNHVLNFLVYGVHDPSFRKICRNGICQN